MARPGDSGPTPEEASLTCPACNERFEVPRPASTTSVEQTTEFRALGPGALGSDIATCPQCGYTDWTPTTTEGWDSHALSEEVKRELAEAVRSFGAPILWTPVIRYEVASRVAAVAGRPKTAQALLELRVAWSAEDEGDRQRAAVWRREAAENLLAALADGAVEQDDRVRVTYLAAELYRRAGDVERAGELFERVKAEAVESDDPSLGKLVRLAESQATEPVDVLPGWY